MSRAKSWLRNNNHQINGTVTCPIILSGDRNLRERLADLAKKNEELTEDEHAVINNSRSFIFTDKDDFILFNKKMLDIGINVYSECRDLSQ